MKNKGKRPRLNQDGEGSNKNNSNNKNKELSGKKLSHALSWALRHQAHAIGLTIAPDGYVPVQEILDSSHPKLQGISLEAIEPVVHSNDKQRFKLEQRPRHIYSGGTDDGTTILCIRANQGHSIKTIDPNLLFTKLSSEELNALPCIVHGTYYEPWKVISQQGLKKMNRTHIHFASGMPKDDGVISGMRLSCTVYVFVNAVKCTDDSIYFFQSDNGVILTAGLENQGSLPPEYFSHVTDESGNILLDNRTQKTATTTDNNQ
jgi:2'-phosphotransferase